MSGSKAIKRLRERFENALAMGVSMRLRLFVFFMLLVATMVVGVVSLFLLMGVFSASTDENKKALENELAHLSQILEAQYGEISAQTLRLSRHLARNIENKLASKGLSVNDLSVRTDLLEGVMDAEYDTLFFSLEKVKASGAFMILNATASRREKEARVSRAGLYFKNWEPNILSDSSPAILFLRGFSRIGQNHDAVLDAQWTMEFDVEDAPYYDLPQKVGAEHRAFLSRLCYWQPATVIKGTSYKAMLCSVPLVDSNGTVFGVCGFEVSDMLFKLTYMPAGKIYGNVFCALAPFENGALDMSRALISWRYIREDEPQSARELVLEGEKKGLSIYAQNNGDAFMGVQRVVNLYAKDSPFAAQKFVLALLAPQADVEASLAADNRKLLVLSLLLLFLGVACSAVFSKWYIRPVLKGFDAIRSGASRQEEASLTRIPEIDDLIKFLYVQGEEPDGVRDKEPSRDSEGAAETLFDSFDAFIENAKTLSRAEESVFNLYLEGRSAREIAQILNLSINTIKTHNKRIFMKLNVSSRRELLTYVQILQRAGRHIK